MPHRNVPQRHARPKATGTDFVSDPPCVRVPVLGAETQIPGPCLTDRSVMTGSPLQTPPRLLCRKLATDPDHTTGPPCGRRRCARRDARRRGRERAGCEDEAERRDMAARCGGLGLPARSLTQAYCRLRRIKGSRPAQPDALAALDPTPAAGDDHRQVARQRTRKASGRRGRLRRASWHRASGR